MIKESDSAICVRPVLDWLHNNTMNGAFCIYVIVIIVTNLIYPVVTYNDVNMACLVIRETVVIIVQFSADSSTVLPRL
jgi:hypothetical protein